MFREEATWAFFCHRKPPPLWRAGSRAHGPQWELEAAQRGSCWEAPVVRWEGRAQPRPPSVSSPARALADRGLGCVPAEPSALCPLHCACSHMPHHLHKQNPRVSCHAGQPLAPYLG